MSFGFTPELGERHSVAPSLRMLFEYVPLDCIFVYLKEVTFSKSFDFVLLFGPVFVLSHFNYYLCLLKTDVVLVLACRYFQRLLCFDKMCFALI